jgi:putative membrane protein
VTETKRRFPAAVFRAGSEPDPRFSLANERTLLACARTALALLAAGVAVSALPIPMDPALQKAAAVILAATGTLLPVHGWVAWRRDERALRLDEPIGGVPTGVLALAGTFVSAAMLLAGMLAW